MTQHKKAVWRLTSVLVGAMAVAAFAGENPSAGTEGVHEPNAALSVAPVYTVNVTRMGKTINVAIETESQQQRELLFGEKRDRKPAIRIFKGDQLLESGSFSFG